MKRLKIIKIALIIFAASFVIHQIYASLYSSVTTSAALYYEMSEGIDASVMVVRDESMVSKSGTSGVAHYVHDDGEKVAKGGILAKFYSDEESSMALTEIEGLEARLSQVREMMGYNDISAVDIDLCNSKVDEALYSLQASVSDGNFTDSEEKITDLLTAINRKQIATGETSNLDSVESSLVAQIEALKSKVKEPIGSIYSDVSGYFVSLRDGYESVIDSKNVMSITPKELKTVKPEAVDENDGSIGKIVSDYNVYFATVVEFDKVNSLKTGSYYTLETELKSSPSLRCQLVRVSEPDADRNVVLVFSCSQINSEMATVRTATVKIVTKHYEGLKVNSKALRVVDGKTGVYVVSGMQAKFVETTVLYTGDSFIICELQNDEKDRLRLYDEVIEKGSKLYDGKIIY